MHAMPSYRMHSLRTGINDFESIMNPNTDTGIQWALQLKEIVDVVFCLSEDELILASRTFDCIAANCDDSSQLSSDRLRAAIHFAIIAGRPSAKESALNYKLTNPACWHFDLMPLTCIDFVYKDTLNELLQAYGCNYLMSLANALSATSQCRLTLSPAKHQSSRHLIHEQTLLKAVKTIGDRKVLGYERVLCALLAFSFQQVMPQSVYFLSWTGSRLFDIVSRELIKIRYQGACSDFKAYLATLRQSVPRLPIEGSLFSIEQILESGIRQLDN